MSDDTITILCVGCQKQLRVPESARGKILRCPVCQKMMKVPAKKRDEENSYDASLEDDFEDVESFPSQPVSHSRAQSRSSNVSRSTRPASSDIDWTSLPAQSPYAPWRPSPRSMPKRSYRAAWIVGTIAVVIVGMVGTIVGVGWFAYSMVSQVASKATEISLPPNSFPTESVNEVVPPEAKTVASAPLVFPALPPATTLAGTDIKVYDVRFTSLTQSQMRTRIYMPRGSHEHASLGCIFTAPAGTPLLHGVELGSEDNMEEILPYVQAGLVVAVYELDGPMPENVTPEMGRAFFDAMKSGYDRFVKAEAGVLNGKSAIDFVLARVPEVDPKKLYSSGHSSAGTLSLLLAAKDSRIAKCIAFSPATDLNRRIGEIARDPSAAAIFANFKEYCVSGSPITYASQYRCPIFILHAMDDDNEPFTSTRTFVMRLKSPSVTFVRERNGGHYEPMVRVGLPKAIEWLKK